MGLYTIGYEGLDLDAFLNKLLNARVAVLCDVRRNAFSMKYGFSKKQLHGACEGVGIRYEHLPELGIPGDERQELHSQADRDALFRRYAAGTLPSTPEAQEHLGALVAAEGRVAIMCFQADPATCHRSYLANALAALSAQPLTVYHLLQERAA